MASCRCSTPSCIRPPGVRLSLAGLAVDVTAGTPDCLALHAAAVTTKVTIVSRVSTVNYSN
jgi:hypothetical protein